MEDRPTTYGEGQDDDNLTIVTVATENEDNEIVGRAQVAIHHQAKQGGKYFGCCCDYRRAVLILGVTQVLLALLDLVFYLGGVASDSYQPPFDDDGLVNELQDLNEVYQLPYTILEGAAVVFGVVSVAGAMHFNRILTAVAIVYAVAAFAIVIVLDVNARDEVNQALSEYGEDTLPTPVYYYGFLVVTFIVWWYPSFFFLWEVHRGIMTQDTYVREDYSCFC